MPSFTLLTAIEEHRFTRKLAVAVSFPEGGGGGGIRAVFDTKGGFLTRLQLLGTGFGVGGWDPIELLQPLGARDGEVRPKLARTTGFGVSSFWLYLI